MNSRIVLCILFVTAWMVFPSRGDDAASGRGEDTASASQVLSVWPGSPPDFKPTDALEVDTSTAESNNVAGKSVIRLGNVQSPELHVFLPKDSVASKTAVVICPGGGYSILAWDLEGTEIAKWLQEIGVTAAVVKYRVPTREEQKNWLAPVQDIQRSIELIKSGAVPGVKVDCVGVLGFSAGGNASVRVATAAHKYYTLDASRDNRAVTRPVEQATPASELANIHPDFAVLVYPAWLVKEDNPSQLIDDITVDEHTPPMFFAHARNDRVSCLSSVTMFTELQKRDIPAALHVFADGGHGFGSRKVSLAHDRWPELCEDWLRDRGWLLP